MSTKPPTQRTLALGIFEPLGDFQIRLAREAAADLARMHPEDLDDYARRCGDMGSSHRPDAVEAKRRVNFHE